MSALAPTPEQAVSGADWLRLTATYASTKVEEASELVERIAASATEAEQRLAAIPSVPEVSTELGQLRFLVAELLLQVGMLRLDVEAHGKRVERLEQRRLGRRD